MQCHAVAPDGCPVLHDHEGAAGDFGQRGKRLGWSDGGGDGDGVDDEGGNSSPLIADEEPSVQAWQHADEQL